MLFIDFSSAFNTIIPQQLINKLNLLGLNNSLCNWILDYTQVSGPIQTTCSNTLSSMRTRPFSHTAVCTQSHKRLSNICTFTCSCTTNHLALFPSQLLDSQCFSLHMYSIYVKHSYSLYSSFFNFYFFFYF